MDEVRASLKLVEKEMGKKFADPDNTLLLSVRSGAALSMPGMMDTVLNLGLNDDIVEGLAKQVGGAVRGFRGRGGSGPGEGWFWGRCLRL
jgi:pyruvate,orthophosphate dikinase